MTIGEYINNHPEKTYSIEYYFEYYCKNCRKSWIEIDNEYSLKNVRASDIGITDYDWIFDLDIGEFSGTKITEVSGTKITIIDENDPECICEDCRQTEWKKIIEEYEE